jgi:hypothetical protein
LTRLVHVIADYGPGALAFAELMQRLGLVLPDLDLQHTRVAPGDTLAAGYCVARLALTSGIAGRLVLHDVAGPDRELERLCVGRTPDGALVAGRDAGWCWSFVVDALRGIWVLDVPARAWPRDPADAVPKAVVRVLAGHRHALRDRLPRAAVPPYPSRAVAYVDGHGNLKTTITGPAGDCPSRRLPGASPRPATWRSGRDPGAHRSAATVSHALGSPASKPRRNQPRRWAAEPCVQASGMTRPVVRVWMRSSPTAAAARSASSRSPRSSRPRS